MAKEKCDLSNEELIERCNEWVSKLAKSGGRDWRLHVPVSFNTDPDMLFCELANRFKELTEAKGKGYSRQDMENAFDAGMDYEYEKHFGPVPPLSPDKETYLSSLPPSSYPTPTSKDKEI